MKKITFLLSSFICALGFSQNLVTNGDFQTGTAAPWYNNAAFVVDLGGSIFVNQANVTSAGNAYDVNLSQNINLTSGLTYQLTFSAFTDAATASRTMIVGLGQNGAPWNALTSTTTLTAVPQVFTYQYTINYGDSVPDRVLFDMGAATGYVFIDNVSVTEVINTCSNGIQDGTETGVDCGGSCAACIVAPTVAAPTPPARATTDVVSLFSDAYTNIGISEWSTSWDDSTVQDVVLGGNAAKKITFTNFLGVQLAALTDATAMTHFHMDYFIPAGTDLVGKVINPKFSNHAAGTGETDAFLLNHLPSTAGAWVSIDVPITDFFAQVGTPYARQALFQYIITSNIGTLFVDNIYLHKNTVLSSASFNTAKVKLYPNPTSSLLNIEAASTIQKVSVVNLLGQEVMAKTVTENTISLDVSTLEAGIYVVKTTVDGNVTSTKFIKE